MANDKPAAKKAVAKKAAPKVLPREPRSKPTSQSPRYAGPVATGDVDYGSEPNVHDEDVISADPARTPQGTYLDQEMRRKREVERARIENREPDLENPPAIQGTPLRVKKS